MKKLILLLLSLLLYLSSYAHQYDFFDDCVEIEIDSISARSLYNSEKGNWLPPKGTYRILSIFVNIVYDLTPHLNPNISNSWGWNVNNQEGINVNPHTQYFNELFDAHDTLPRQGFFTRFFSECSFDDFVLLSDFLSVEINQSRIKPDSSSFVIPL